MTSHSAIRAIGIHAVYGRTAVLHGVDVSVDPGTFTLITGPNGAGKSTLIEILAGALRPSAGRVIRASPVALVVQRPAVPATLPLTVADTVRIGAGGIGAAQLGAARLSAGGLGAGGRRARAAARRLAVAEAIDAVGLTPLAGRSLHELSGGQRQRALLAQGLARGASILLLDEAAAGLDAESRARTREILTGLVAGGATVCAVSHDPDDLAVAHRVIRLDAGRVVSDEPQLVTR
ncbi:metal ABC transporter ATP-binding protein [Leucobacter chromiireducens]|uniref:metal ABC transporter ATP-binding protein n=1 Tax=Leucobacter chromiireducens TaxID=283877 RepID=UPI0019CFCBC7|nr:ATP-binding cassette domain-containing protein [Leucobacter chromiireducens]